MLLRVEGVARLRVQTRRGVASLILNGGIHHAVGRGAGRGFTFGVRHRHLDPKVNPTDPSAASYNPKCV